MKQKFLAIAALLAVLSTGLSARDASDIRLLYWNIQNGMWSDQSNNYDNFVSYVKGLDPDICVWCEGASIYKSGTDEKLAADDRYLPFNWDSLAERYGHNYVYVGGWRDNYPQVVTSKFPIRNVKRILGDPDDIIVSHGAAWVQIEVQGQTLNLVTLHTWPQKYAYKAENLEASANEHGGDKYRAREIEYICRQTIGSVSGADGELWMMMGDFNSRSRVDAKQYDLPEDSPAYLVHDYVREKTPYLDIIEKWHDNAFFPTTGSGKRIDFVYATSAMYSRIRDARILGDEGWMTILRDPKKISNFYHPSDHRPIIVDFNLTDAPSRHPEE